MTAPIEPQSRIFLDLSARIKLRVSGKDHLRFLNGQMTNDISKASPSEAIAACVLNVKGRMDAHVFVSAFDQGVFIDSAPELREKLPLRLERYAISDDVQIEDVSSVLIIFHVLSISAPSLPGYCRIVSANRFRQSGWDVWATAADHDKVFDLLAVNFTFSDGAAAEVFRIEQGVPRWGRELTEEINPVEADLEETCINYQKGCYIGQEVISRMKMSGQRNKKLCGLTSAQPMQRGMKLFLIGEEKKEVGWITSATRSKRLAKEIGLGYIKRPFPPSGGFRLDAVDQDDVYGSQVVRVEIVDLPFNS
jgi:tRNA-modifying protein YgfZ